MDPRENSSRYLDLELNDEYKYPEYGSRPGHDDYFTNREFLLQYSNTESSKTYQNYEDITVKRYIGSGVAFVSLITDNLLSHPFLILRRQCQVNHASVRYHLLPFTLVPTVCHLHQHQGLTTLWKGLGSALLVRGMTLGIEDLISKLTPWPKEISWHSSLKQFCQHTMLKCVSLAIVTPFYSASFVETVQSEIASEKPGILDVFREGFIRLLNWGAPAKGRMLPIWALIVPTVALGITRYLFSMMVRGATFRILQCTMSKDATNAAAVQERNLTASLTATIASDVVFYPCETVVHRLYLQGTRTIIDNLDSGRSVLAILTNYSGVMDCYNSCLSQEGTSGLYKGFGALILQYAAHVALIKLSRFVLSEIGSLLEKPKSIPPPPVDNSPPAISNIANPPKSYLLP
ncbi:mitochondrial outer membrane protein SLC25A46-like [Rhynchophorus ferrugineus]|uniref:mitochondrial outer membrane protein SLC25A46-like n=1 Tax=Rhynchophorus ferrugineus TaxID=354439 RepID=UPI003FCE535F